MKTLIFSIILVSLTIVGCTNGSSDDNVKEFIPGTYVNVFEDKITENTSTVGSDTLEITRLTETGSETYGIVRKMQYRRTVDGVTQPAEYKSENWQGEYDKEGKVVREIGQGKVISFVPEKNILYVNQTEYKKIK